MSDISQCSNKTCPSAKECYRFRAKPNPFWQAYADFNPTFQGRCDWFIRIAPGTEDSLAPFVEGEPTCR